MELYVSWQCFDFGSVSLRRHSCVPDFIQFE